MILAPAPTNVTSFLKVEKPDIIALPVDVIVAPTPAAPTSRPPLAVTIPTESTLVTSS